MLMSIDVCTYCTHVSAPGSSRAQKGGTKDGLEVPTWHVRHPAVAALQHGLLFTAQSAGRHTIGGVALQLRLPELAFRPAVAPRLGQIS